MGMYLHVYKACQVYYFCGLYDNWLNDAQKGFSKIKKLLLTITKLPDFGILIHIFKPIEEIAPNFRLHQLFHVNKSSPEGIIEYQVLSCICPCS